MRLGKLAAVVVLAALLPAPVEASHSSGYHWKRSASDPNAHTYGNYRTIGVHNGADRNPWMQDIINDATERWNDSTWQPTVLVPYNLPESTWPWPCDWTPPPSGWGISICYGEPGSADYPGAWGSAQIRSFYDSSGHRGWVRIVIKAGLHPDVYRHTITHELGHALGLSHQPAGGASVMSTGGGWSGHPDAHDQDMLASIYSHPH